MVIPALQARQLLHAMMWVTFMCCRALALLGASSGQACPLRAARLLEHTVQLSDGPCLYRALAICQPEGAVAVKLVKNLRDRTRGA